MGRLAIRFCKASRPAAASPSPDRSGSGRGKHALLALALSAASLALPATASAAAPQVTSTSVAEVAETSAILRGKIDPGAKKTEYRFEYITLADFKADGESFGAGTVSVPSPEPSIPGHPRLKGDLEAGSTAVTNLTVLEGALDVGQTITSPGPGIQLETTVAALGEGALTLSKPATATGTGVELLSTGPQPVSTRVEGLTPGTAYRLRLSAHHGVEAPVHGQPVSFATLAPSPVFGPCPNDLFRTGGPGVLLPPTHPSAMLPDCRGYEQVSPTEKDGADAVGEPDTLAAAPDGESITFLSSFGMPGSEGSQIFPSFLATRSGTGWSARGLLPPAAAGSSAYLLGHTPDFAYSVAEARRLNPQGTAYESALFLREGASGPPTRITTLYEPRPGDGQPYSYVGASASGHYIFFESAIALPPSEGAEPLSGAIQGSFNVYAYDTATGALSLATQMNSAEETETLLPHGAFAGPYEWERGSGSFQLAHGGGDSGSYTQDTHAVSEDGSLFFTAAGTSQLYERVNPTAPQSQMEGSHCTEPDKACTYHVSATHKTNSLVTEDGSDPAGPQPAAFMAASANGDAAFFTSPEKLTNDANTGPEQPPAQIGRAKIGEEAEDVEEGFIIPAHALGMATSADGEYLYWADPTRGTIGRANLKAPNPAATVEAEFIVPDPTKFETHHHTEPGVLHVIPSAPRFVAVGPCAEGGECVYWTNSGALRAEDNFGNEVEPVGGGSIGRAALDGSGVLIPDSVKSEFIPGQVETSPGAFVGQVTAPQGIAVNSEHIYWANAPANGAPVRAIARAAIGGGAVEPNFWTPPANRQPVGVALSESYVYYTANALENNFGVIERIGLEGGEEESAGIGEAGMHGVALAGGYLYWANQHEGAIGRYLVSEFEKNQQGGHNCAPGQAEHCEPEYITPQGVPEGLAADPSGEHIYWSVNGEAPGNPGNDLYRFQLPGTGGCEEAAGCLNDLTVDPVGDGGEALGVLGASADGSYLYFVANGALAAGASPGDCRPTPAHGNMFDLSGHCNLYLAHEGELRFIARLKVGRGEWVAGGVDKFDWVPSPNLSSSVGFDLKYPRQAAVSPDGRVLSFLSSEPLTAYDNSGACKNESVNPLEPCPEYYRFDAATGKLSCLTCNPTGALPTAAPTLLHYATPFSGRPGGSSQAASVLARNLTDEGARFFFQSTEALVGTDTDGAGGCPDVRLGDFSYPACQDVYEWEAPGTGSCTESNSSYSPQNEGCIYLLSPGDDARPALFADADETGNNAFFFTRSSLVGQDEDQLFDLYDARKEGGLASQNPPAPKPPCEGEACKPGATAPPNPASPVTSHFQSTGNVKGLSKSRCPKGKRSVRREGHARCVKPHHRHAKRHNRRSHR